MKTTRNGYRITKNGSVIKSTEKCSVTKLKKEGNVIKENGVYYFFTRKQGNKFIYTP